MKSINLKLYSFNELPENVQNRIVENWRNDDQYFWQDENYNSLKAFCNIFQIRIKDYDYGYRNYINAAIDIDDEILTLSGLRLAKYIWNNYKKHLFKGKYYSIHANGKYKTRHSRIMIESDCILTGYCIDHALIDPLLEFLNKPDNRDFERLLNDCLDNFIIMCSRDYNYWLSRECIVEDIDCNDYTFLINGEIATKYELLAA